jgi:mRNA interferase MazF
VRPDPARVQSRAAAYADETMNEPAEPDPEAPAAARPIRRGDVYWARVGRPAPPARAADHGGGDGGADRDEGDDRARGSDDDEAAVLAHPHVVLQEDALNQSRLPTVVVCALTSNLGRASEPGNVLLEPGEAGLPRQSVVVVSQVSAVEKRTLGAYLGALSPARVEQIFDGLRFQQASFFRR